MLSEKKTGIGNRLRTIRESMNISEKDIAANLYLNSKIITSIEEEAFEEGPAMTFMRGYIRSYARLCQLPEAEVNQALQQLDNLYPLRKSISTRMQPYALSSNHHFIRGTTYFIVFLLLVLVGTWWKMHSQKTPLPYLASATTTISEPPATDRKAEVKPVDSIQPLAEPSNTASTPSADKADPQPMIAAKSVPAPASVEVKAPAATPAESTQNAKSSPPLASATHAAQDINILPNSTGGIMAPNKPLSSHPTIANLEDWHYPHLAVKPNKS